MALKAPRSHEAVRAAGLGEAMAHISVHALHKLMTLLVVLHCTLTAGDVV